LFLSWRKTAGAEAGRLFSEASMLDEGAGWGEMPGVGFVDMAGKGIDHSTCPEARVVGALWSERERRFAEVLLGALRQKVKVFVKVRAAGCD